MKKEKIQEKLNRIKTKIQRRVIRYAPAALGLLTTWMPVNASSSTGNNISKNNIEVLANKERDSEADNRLALASPDVANAYNKSIADVSISTEAGDFTNPTAVATGNGYYGQHQLGNSANSAFMVRKYIAYTLVYGSPDFQQSVKENLMVGTNEAKNRLIEAMGVSLEKYANDNASENAFMASNPSYKHLFNAMKVSPTAFSKVHNEHHIEGAELQKMFIFQVYLNLMPKSLKNTMAANPRINFAEIHPAVWGSVIAIAVKQGNGSRFAAALSGMEHTADRDLYAEIQAKELSKFEKAAKNGSQPLVVLCHAGELNPNNMIAKGTNDKDKVLIIYDKEGRITPQDITTEPGRRVIVTKAEKPADAKSNRSLNIHDISNQKVNIGKIMNNTKWLKSYCGSFSKVYNSAKTDLHKIPTLDTYYELSIILNKPQLYEMMLKSLRKGPDSEETLAALQTKNIKENMKMLAVADATFVNKQKNAEKIAAFQLRREQYMQKNNNNLIARMVRNSRQSNS